MTPEPVPTDVPLLKAEAWEQAGTPGQGGVLIISDHASAIVPDDVELGCTFDPRLDHEGSDIGVRDVNLHLLHRLAQRDSGGTGGTWAVHGAVSRLVIDCNRPLHSPELIPARSDDLLVPGNAALDADGRQARITRFYEPYHAHIAASIVEWRPAMLLSVHSFTRSLARQPEVIRPWQAGVLYNQDDRLARIALRLLADEGLRVGDNEPYSGRILNHSMDTHAEANAIPYVGIEIRQFEIMEAEGIHYWASLLERLIDQCRNHLAQMASAGE